MGLFGKLFEKKNCDICGGDIGLLGNRKLEDGNLCKNCANKLSPWFSDRRSSTVAQIREQLDYREKNREEVSKFHTSLEESGALDDYLESIGMDRIAWIGTAPQFLDPYWEAYIPDDHYLTEYTGDSTELLIPDRGGEDMISLWWIKEGAFENSDLTTVVFYGNINSIETNAFSGSGNLKDLWFTAALLRWVDDENGLCPDCLSGLPEDVTVHLPACLTEEQRSHVEGRLKESGLAETTVFDYYSFREE